MIMYAASSNWVQVFLVSLMFKWALAWIEHVFQFMLCEGFFLIYAALRTNYSAMSSSRTPQENGKLSQVVRKHFSWVQAAIWSEHFSESNSITVIYRMVHCCYLRGLFGRGEMSSDTFFYSPAIDSVIWRLTELNRWIKIRPIQNPGAGEGSRLRQMWAGVTSGWYSVQNGANGVRGWRFEAGRCQQRPRLLLT